MQNSISTIELVVSQRYLQVVNGKSTNGNSLTLILYLCFGDDESMILMMQLHLINITLFVFIVDSVTVKSFDSLTLRVPENFVMMVIFISLVLFAVITFTRQIAEVEHSKFKVLIN